ncbi:hypothetical protein E3N88_09822 [Mikania micrantha]|uniref:Reverse transcriptase domain-containing protein n=1 Tax=Mikania micrantha TaxID=192012 RepID=A0A5N6PMF2_9ASTR|nr:hypothetical protein E3N88_09822 [Mikania micrantha]
MSILHMELMQYLGRQEAPLHRQRKRAAPPVDHQLPILFSDQPPKNSSKTPPAPNPPHVFNIPKANDESANGSIRDNSRPVAQKKRDMATERSQAVIAVVEKLVLSSILKEVQYYTWIENPVMVQKHDDTWRMCVDFKDLNKACPKDCYPLPEIDHKPMVIDSGATYQRVIDSVFKYQIGSNMEAYVDDLVIKSSSEEDMIRDIKETFDNLKKINMKLNPGKCSFGF